MARRGNGEGSIYQRKDGRWESRLTIPGGGRRRRKAFYGKTRREVQEQLTAALRDLQRGLPVRADERRTFASAVGSWLTSVESTVRPRTFASYTDMARLHVTPALGRLPLAKVTPQHVRELLAAKLTDGLSPRSVQYVHAIVRMVLGQALRDGTVGRNVATLVSPPRIRRHEIASLSPDEARGLLSAAKGDRFEALYTVAIALGLRQGEALGLRWSDVDFDARTLTVRHALQVVPTSVRRRAGAVPDRYILAEPKTSRSRRTIHLPAVAASALREHRVRQLEERVAAGPAWHDRWDLIFATSIGTPLDARNVTRAFSNLLERNGLAHVRFHDLRHSAATLMLAQGVPPRVIMETLGHSQIGMTMNLYAHVLPSLQRDAADRMDDVLGAEFSR